ncbi:hypothetical protein F4553_008055 [Allocatelliglobosispora scoriae]|uniref:Uncharacterized protein n=1 Tax=Allocatelliglobosispora scoriae TaxID=643052 RepID=A0A841C756_9ACTN|nr:hypothetical protein [Allocatelliglobosispora scoriae]MBB5874621.1 hypothetical protein [Allocatelliglobosispora scoriae]
MFLADPALRAIAAATNDVLPEHLWRHDTDGGDWAAESAARLDNIATGFNTNARLLNTALAQVRDEAGTALRDAGPQHPHHMGTILLTAVSLLERHQVLRTTLVEAYTYWRRHQPDPHDQAERHILAQRYVPDAGVLTLRRHGRDTWHVIPDRAAAIRWGVPFADQLIGAITESGDGWYPVAFLRPTRRHALPQPVSPLPAVDTDAAACRCLLRWWRLRLSARWLGRNPTQLTDAEITDLTA